MESYDLIVIGSGPAGYAAAMKAFDYKMKVCLVEAKNLGGIGIMNGALTSKTMWELSQDYAVAASIDRGYRASGLVVDYSAVRKTVIKAAKTKQYQLLSQIETFSGNKSKTGSIVLKRGYARFIDNKTIELQSKDHKELIIGNNFVIATGTRPRAYPGIDVDQKRILNSDGILNLKSFPERMVIIGSGIIGCEFAAIFSNFKQTEIHLLDRENRVIPSEDDDISDYVGKNLEDNGVTIHHTANLRTIKKHPTHLEVILDYSDGHSRVIEVDVALISIGRVANYEKLNIENIGITPLENGYIPVDEFSRVKNNKDISNIYAAGDITGQAQLYSLSEHQGRYAVDCIVKNKIQTVDFSTLPTIMFFKPIVAAVGMNEKVLQEEKIAYKVVYYSNELVNRAIAMRNTKGFVKLIVSNDDEKKILGMRASGPQASAYIISIAHLINQGNRLDEVIKTIHPHPSVTEGIQECFRVLNSNSVFKPTAFPEFIKLRTWTPKVTN